MAREKLEAAEREETIAYDGDESNSIGAFFREKDMMLSLLFMLIALIIATVLIILLLLCRYLCLEKCWKPVVKLMHTIERKLMFSSVLRACMVSFLGISIQMWYGWRDARVEPGLNSRLNFMV